MDSKHRRLLDLKQLFFTFVTLFWLLDKTRGHSENSKLLLVSFDGFRWDYLDRVKAKGRETPNFDTLINGGVNAKFGVKNTFVTKTFPNHYTIVTGMYEENHGVVGNNMYDPVFNETFDMTKDSRVAKWWNNGTLGDKKGPEPIWVTNERDEETLVKKRTGVMFWPGSETVIHFKTPSYFRLYDSTYPNKSRIDTIVNWFTEANPINLGLLYFSEPDHLGHSVGPDSPQMIEMIVALDELVGYLVQRLREKHLLHQLNIIITSDHGMAQITKQIDISKKVNLSLCEVIAGHSPVFHIIPKKGHEEEVLRQLRSLENVRVFLKDDIPRDFHYTHNRRILDIIISADVGYDIVKEQGSWSERGNHGYNNSVKEMHPFFIAHGPAFKRGYQSTQMFSNVDIYPLMCEILDLEPAPHDGSLENIAHILHDEDEEHGSFFSVTMITFLLTAGFAATIAGVFAVAACRVYRITKHRRHQLVLPLNMIDGQTHVLLANTTDEEEIP